MKKVNERNTSKSSNNNPDRVPAVDQAARIMFFFTNNRLQHASLTEICQALGIYKSRGYAILKTLADHGFITRNEETKRYSLGPALIHLSRKALENLDIRDAAQPYLLKLAGKTQGTVLLGVVSNDDLFVIAKQDGDSHLGVTIEIGHRFHLTAGAHGKAITAFLPDEMRKRLLARKNLFFHGSPEALNHDRLIKELAECLKTGFALDMGDLQPGIHAVATPVFSEERSVSGALIIIGTFDETTARSYGPLLKNAAVEISHTMGARVPEILQKL